MNDLTAVFEIDFKAVFIGIATITVGALSFFKIKDELFKRFGIEFKAQRQKREDHEMLIKTVESVKALSDRHDRDENELKDCLKNFIEETRRENAELREAIRKQDENNLTYRDVSRGIREDLTNSIKALAEGQEERDQQIQALMCGSKELLGITIDSLYSHYVELGGIPENEVDEFNDIYDAYDKLKGNGKRKIKHSYVVEHLPVIPVETKLVIKHGE